jgi:hypothetical protein
MIAWRIGVGSRYLLGLFLVGLGLVKVVGI